MIKISVVISAYNEEKNLSTCLDSLKDFAYEVIVVDNSSTDKTSEIAKKYGAKIYRQKNDPTKIDIQKNFGFSKAGGDWILNLDADEILTTELAEEIKSEIKNPEKMGDGYWIPRKNVSFNKWIEHTGWYPDYQLRFFKTGKGKFVSKKVHEPLSVDGEIRTFSSPILHNNYQSIDQFLNRLIKYTDSEAEALLENGYKFNASDIVRIPFEEFLKRFFSREGYKDGLHGLILSFLMAFYHLVIILKIWEKNKFPQESNSLELFGEESKKVKRDIIYWIVEAKKSQTNNPIRKALLSTSRKISR